MKGLILAGGKGTRLRPLTINTPKPVVPVANAPFLLYQIDLMRSAGIHDIILSLSYQPRKIEDLLKDGSDYGVTIKYAVEGVPLGTGGAFKNAEEQIDSSTVVFNGDILTSLDLNAVIARHKQAGAVATIVLTPVDNPSAYGLVETDSDGRVLRFIEKPEPSQMTCNTINAGVYVLEPSVLRYMPKGEPYSFERGLFPTLLENKELVLSYILDGYWIDIGTPQKYLEVHHDILSGRFRSPRMAGKSNGTYPAGAVIDALSIIDSDVTIRSGARIENSVIGRNCKINESAQVLNSVLWPGTTVDAEARITNSIIGKGCMIGPSAVLNPGTVLGDKTVLTDFSPDMILPIKFGTDGWRGIIADDFTFENVQHAAQATAMYFNTVPNTERAVLIGFDGRFQSQAFARKAAEVFAGNGLRVVMMDRIYPTPYISFEVRRRRFAGGVVITASHNPSSFNGFKVKAHFGGSATPAITAEIEKNLGQFPVRQSSEGIEITGPENYYFDHLRSLVDWDRIAKSGLKAVVDSMYGSGTRILESMLQGTSCSIETIHGVPDPLLAGISPEPMMPQLKPLAERVVQTGSHIGLATDGDADRLGIIDETGQFMSTLQVMPLLLLHAYRTKGWRGAVVRTVSQSLIVPRIAASLGLAIYECPIGFKNIGELMLQQEILIGGEESGGIGLSRHMPERDGIFLNLLMLDLLAVSGKKPTELVREMWKEFGEFRFGRRDLHVPIEEGKAVVNTLKNDPPSVFAGLKVQSVGTLDGTKVMLDQDSWILFRQSGTEPLLRVYCEAPSSAAVDKILAAGLKFVEQFGGTGVHVH